VDVDVELGDRRMEGAERMDGRVGTVGEDGGGGPTLDEEDDGRPELESVARLPKPFELDLTCVLPDEEGVDEAAAGDDLAWTAVGLGPPPPTVGTRGLDTVDRPLLVELTEGELGLGARLVPVPEEDPTSLVPLDQGSPRGGARPSPAAEIETTLTALTLALTGCWTRDERVVGVDEDEGEEVDRGGRKGRVLPDGEEEGDEVEFEARWIAPTICRTSKQRESAVMLQVRSISVDCCTFLRCCGGSILNGFLGWGRVSRSVNTPELRLTRPFIRECRPDPPSPNVSSIHPGPAASSLH
jgi:hypothetical protein